MKKILFVDDEPNILDGLKRMLRPLHREWDMAFAQSGEAALETLAGGDYDVVVSDMRMPGMDGAELFGEISKRHPQIVRIVLSGQFSKEAAMRAVGTAHQFLAKPCDADTLKRTIDRAFGLRGVLTNESLKQVLAQAKSLPSMPSLYLEITEELQYPDASIHRIGKIISKDPAMTAKMLQLVNSAFFGLSRKVSGAAEAVALLGTETLASLVLSIGVFSEFDRVKVDGFDLKGIWSHSTRSAAIAKAIAKAEKSEKSLGDEAMMAGLLHDTGKLILAQNLPDEYGTIIARARTRRISMRDAEEQVLGASHAEIGAYLLGLWGLPDSIVEAVAFHHQPAKCAASAFDVVTAVHVANALEHDCAKGDGASGAIDGLDLDYLATLGLADRVPEWRDICIQTLSEEVGV